MTKLRASAVAEEALLVASVDAVGVTRLPRLLHEANLRVTLLGSAGLAVGRSRFVHSYLRTANDPSVILREARRHLQVSATSYRLVILADDPLFWAAAQQKDLSWMQPWFPVAVARRSATLQIASKLDFIHRAAALGLLLPRFHMCTNIEEAQAAATDLGYPVFLKIAHGFAGSALRFVYNAQDLAEQAPGFIQGQPFIVQEFIAGEVGATPVLFAHGHPVWWFSYLMRDPWPNRFASASALEIIDHPDIAPILEGIGAFTGFHGAGAIDWVRHPETDRLYLIEFNPRPTPALYLSTYAGVPFSTALSSWLYDTGQVHQPQSRQEPKRKLLLFPQHVHFAVDTRKPGAFLAAWRDAPWSDPFLLAAQLRRVLTHYLPPRWRQRLQILRAARCRVSSQQ